MCSPFIEYILKPYHQYHNAIKVDVMAKAVKSIIETPAKRKTFGGR